MNRGNRAVKSLGLSLTIAFALVMLSGNQNLAEDCAKAAKYAKLATEKLEKLADIRYAYEKAVELCPTSPDYRQKLGDIYRSIALQTLCEMRKSPEAADKRDEWVKKYYGMLDKAASQYEETTARTPGHEGSLLGLAHTYLLQNLPEKAEQGYQEVLSVNAANTEAAAGLQKTRELKGRADGGFKTSEQIKQLAKQDSDSCERLGTMGFAPQTVQDMAPALNNRLSFNEILFDEWSYAITRPEAVRQLSEIGQALSSPELAGYNIVVEGHTDHRGGEERNMALSRNRATAIKNYLCANFGVTPQRITEQGFGYSRPRVPISSPEKMLVLNRRVEVLFLPPTQ